MRIHWCLRAAMRLVSASAAGQTGGGIAVGVGESGRQLTFAYGLLDVAEEQRGRPGTLMNWRGTGEHREQQREQGEARGPGRRSTRRPYRVRRASSVTSSARPAAR